MEEGGIVSSDSACGSSTVDSDSESPKCAYNENQTQKVSERHHLTIKGLS